jgi:shikimate kinase
MGVGKSSVAKALAVILHCEELDLDEFIEKSEKMLVSEIIERKGEAYFRTIETQYLRRALERGVRIISLGGGTWTIEENRNLIKEFGYTTLWLDSSFDRCWANIKASGQERPLARSRKKAERVFSERQKFYALADFRLYVEFQMTPYEVAEAIVKKLALR